MDHLTSPGATALAARIRDYWADRGKRVVTHIETLELPRGAKKGFNAPIYCVRSNMINGHPQE